MRSTFFLPVGILVSFLAAWFLPEAGRFLADRGAVPAAVIVIFLCNGYTLSIGKGVRKYHLLRAFLMGLFLSLIICPLLTSLLLRVIAVHRYLIMGLIVMAAMPPTTSSAIVVARLSGGDAAWAVLLTIGLNLTGVFILPYTLGHTLGGTVTVGVPVLGILVKLILLVLLPAAVGVGLRRLIRRPLPSAGRQIPSLSVLVLLFAFNGRSHDMLASLDLSVVPLIAVCAAAVHLGLLALNTLAARLLKLSTAERHSYIFVCSQKTLPLALTVLGLLLPRPGLAVIPCVVFYYFQLLSDSLWAGYLRRRIKAEAVRT